MALRVFLAVGLAVFVGAEPGLAAPAPELGRTALVNTVSGTVLVKERGEQRFHDLSNSPTLVGMGTVLDATRGRVRVRTAAGEGRPLNDGVFWRGSFVLSQDSGGRGVTELKLTGGDPGACAAGAHASAGSSGLRRRLWGNAHGNFQSRGDHGTASVRGTKWVMEDRCDGTRTAVKRGVVKTDTQGGELVFRVSEGQVAQYLCDFDGLDPVSGAFCTAVFSSPNVGTWGAGLVLESDATSYDLCLTDPTGEERCEPHPLSEPSSGLRDSTVICTADRGPGSYSLRWLVGGLQLGPPLGFTIKTSVGQGCVSIP